MKLSHALLLTGAVLCAGGMIAMALQEIAVALTQ